MKFPISSFQIAATLIEQKLAALMQRPSAEPADLPETPIPGRSALRLLGHAENTTAKENPSKIVTDSAITSETRRKVS